MNEPKKFMDDVTIKLVTWKCAFCEFGKAWTKNPFSTPTAELVTDRAPYVVTLADGKKYGFCSRGCVKTKALLVGIEAIVRQQANSGWATPAPAPRPCCPEAVVPPQQPPPYYPPPIYPPTAPFRA